MTGDGDHSPPATQPRGLEWTYSLFTTLICGANLAFIDLEISQFSYMYFGSFADCLVRQSPWKRSLYLVNAVSF